MASEGLHTIASTFEPKVTMDRLEAAVRARGLLVFARIDHADGAARVQLALRPTELLIFGHAKGGTPLMQANQVSGIDLPLKALVWQDAGGKTWLTYNEPSWIAERHGLGPDMGRPDMGRAVAALAALLHNVAREATGQVPERGTDARGSAPQITS